jgi:ribonuclease BN (tRNA processing enzyme)
MKLIMLGSGGFIPTEEAQTACYMIPEHGILLDAGSGLYRFSEYLQTESLDVYITHSHADHTSGLFYLFGGFFKHLMGGAVPPIELERFQETMHAANQALSSVRIHADESILPKLKNSYYPGMVWCALQAQEELPGGGRLTPFLCHPAHPEIGFRLEWPGHSLAYITDSVAMPAAATIEHIRGVDLLLHDCNGPDSSADIMTLVNHSHPASVAQVAAEADVKRLVLIHKNPLNWEITEDLPAARQIFPNLEIGYDGMEVEF